MKYTTSIKRAKSTIFQGVGTSKSKSPRPRSRLRRNEDWGTYALE